MSGLAESLPEVFEKPGRIQARRMLRWGRLGWEAVVRSGKPSRMKSAQPPPKKKKAPAR
ncbi:MULTISPECIES: hypothetical protein [unclassified Variovorax]|uniref:hypothetical protein n=1 Tax=unclassified Variovorax TaxID=663243 RepID=UPI002B23B090|nr:MULTISPECIES: hypothetical protein [unclassified Variovorax]MEB0113455.1 hypothetical protein [Variovorax sp. RTB1]